MNADSAADDPGPPDRHPTQPTRRARRLVGHLVGLVLLGAAVWAVVAHRADATRAWENVRSAPPWLLAAALLLPAANWLIVSVSFWVLMRRFGRIGLWEMLRLIGAAGLGNYLPLRPGMMGRIAYHRAVNNIGVRHSVKVIAVGMACGLAAVLSIVLTAAAMAGVRSLAAWAAALAALPAAGLIGWFALRGSRPLAGVVALTYAIRCADMTVWVLRYAVAFALVGSPLPPAGVAAVTGASQIAMTVPFVGNGLGLREWAVGLTARALPQGLSSPMRGVEADLCNRIAELTVAIPIGLLSYASLRAGLKSRRHGHTSVPPGSPDPGRTRPPP